VLATVGLTFKSAALKLVLFQVSYQKYFDRETTGFKDLKPRVWAWKRTGSPASF